MHTKERSHMDISNAPQVPPKNVSYRKLVRDLKKTPDWKKVQMIRDLQKMTVRKASLVDRCDHLMDNFPEVTEKDARWICSQAEMSLTPEIIKDLFRQARNPSG